MERSEIEKIGRVLVRHLQNDRLIPREFLDELAHILDGGSSKASAIFLELWNTMGQEANNESRAMLDVEVPLLLSRGYASVIPEDELARYLPEEKILINKDFFRAKLDRLDFSSLDSAKERVLIEALQREAIGLSKDDVILYYNMIKLSKLAGKKAEGGKQMSNANTSDYPENILKLFEQQFELSPENWAKVNGGKSPDRQALRFVIEDAIRRKRINPAIFINYLGVRNDKYIQSLKDFIKFTVSSRGEDIQETLILTGVYLLLNGSPAQTLEPLNLSTPLLSFVSDRIGRVRTIYYASIVFMNTLMYVLFAQIYELSSKFYEVDSEQQKKLLKLYSSEDRLAMLLSNAVNMGLRKITEFKTETREIQNNFKKFTSGRKDFLSAADLFRTDYR
jgi:hypothetical protein